ncbi:hypothetical protein C5T94_20255 [Raoultella ornithinolytica]|nr:hypothetical protein MC50_022330 [Raoultella planticola]PQH13445.1 hypothetical protein C5T92_19255 [Raoultella ornithinolytica]PNK80778.1 hypothetical protein CEP62_023150 [Raoultella planticola]PQH21601.1 hypothetical protein C5T95_22810 [Raoultella ornithinolytica]PQH35688.1 hypothetical protein C5T94_20255 [Raoultella ornithinolytica]
MRLCARGSVKAVQQRSFMLWGKSRPIPVVNWLVSPGGTRHCIAKSVRYSISHEGNGMIREEDKPAWNLFWVKVIALLAAVAVLSFACWGGK